MTAIGSDTYQQNGDLKPWERENQLELIRARRVSRTKWIELVDKVSKTSSASIHEFTNGAIDEIAINELDEQ